MPYQVVWERCNVFSADGERSTLIRGEYLPGEIDAAQVSNLAVIGAVRFVDASAAPLPVLVVAEPVSPVEIRADATATLLAGAAGDPPAKNAPKAAWLDYALTADPALTREQADEMTKDQLVDTYGG